MESGPSFRWNISKIEDSISAFENFSYRKEAGLTL